MHDAAPMCPTAVLHPAAAKNAVEKPLASSPAAHRRRCAPTRAAVPPARRSFVGVSTRTVTIMFLARCVAAAARPAASLKVRPVCTPAEFEFLLIAFRWVHSPSPSAARKVDRIPRYVKLVAHKMGWLNRDDHIQVAGRSAKLARLPSPAAGCAHRRPPWRGSHVDLRATQSTP